MRSVLGYAVTLGIVGIMAGGCRSDTSRQSGQGKSEPSGANPSASQAPGAQEPKSEPPAIGGGPAGPSAEKKPITPKGAVASIAAEQCNREVRCSQVGQNKTYNTRAECVSKVEHDRSKDINASVCSRGVNEANLNRCIQSLRNEGCSPVSLEYAEACKSDGICVK
jgi:hypothetical protein